MIGSSLFVLVLCVSTWAQHTPPHPDDNIDIYGNFGKAWDKFRKVYNKTYSTSQETVYREQVFRRTFHFLRTVDEQFKNGTRLFSVGVNHFADMTPDEVVANYTGYKPPTLQQLADVPLYAPLFGDTPDSVDWRANGFVTPVKNQGQCGACWAFSATGALEGQLFKRTRRLVSLSEQNLMDCTGPRYGTNGCNGGQMVGAFQYVQDAGGLDTEARYPYRQGTNFQCQFSNSFEARRVSVTGYTRVPPRNERVLQDALSRIGPISIAINASPQTFMFYKNGVYTEPNCDPRGLNHAVLLVGYGQDRGVPYWIVKNSWGTGWGEAGYVKILRNRNICGMSEDASFPSI
ncbi:cathepsin K-like [Dermacentor andersoni]|uniref:cathepsin K-like n=1 Tax=Dermacentor andersoni TaxID=34620 RepID=UPI002415F890|nr:procathepsin L-like [Dermacentor andersoni]